ncbi:MAG TPA: hypothetical protein VGN73_11830 [Gemmatimonadaceae bacterium]|nr:hypothetical protein [Gemmatimonadaceae bacterium]
MNQHPQTLSEMFGLDERYAETAIGTVEQSECYRALKEGQYSNLPAVFWHGGAATILTTLQRAFNFPIANVLSGAWNKYRELWKYTDRTKYPAGTTSFAEIGSHTINSVQERSIDVLFNGAKVASVPFKLDLRIKVKAHVTITDARFMAIRLGSLSFEGILSCAGAELLKRSSKEAESPFELDLGKGIPILPSVSRRQELPPSEGQDVLPA